MPIYEYRCTECGEGFEKLVASFGSAADTNCPRCGSKKVKKMLSSFSSRGSTASTSSLGSCASPGCG